MCMMPPTERGVCVFKEHVLYVCTDFYVLSQSLCFNVYVLVAENLLYDPLLIMTNMNLMNSSRQSY